MNEPRDTRLPPRYWRDGERVLGELIADGRPVTHRYVPEQARRGKVFVKSGLSAALQLIGTRYSGGEPIAGLLPAMNEAITIWSTWTQYATGNDESTLQLDLLRVDDNKSAYYDALWLASVAFCVDGAESARHELATVIGDVGGTDPLLARLTDAPTERDSMWFSRPFGSLATAFTVPPDEAERVIAKYLHDWRRNTRFLWWWSALEAVENESVYAKYFGYWAWEVAGVVAAAGIDDASFRDHPHYPRDLVDHYRRT
jgi:hypothetical protein